MEANHVADIVYVCRPGDKNEELKYSLRSLQNMPHDRVWISGYVPTWTRNVCPIPVPLHPSGNKYRICEENLKAACLNPEVSDPFYLFNDDFFLMQPMEYIPILHRGPLRKVIEYYLAKVSKSSKYVIGMQQIEKLILQKGISTRPLSYEVHCPLLIQKEGMLEVLSLRPESINCYHLRTMYGNMFGIGGQLTEDVKVYKDGSSNEGTWEKMPLLSTSDEMFKHHKIGKYIQQALVLPSPYEQGHAH